MILNEQEKNLWAEIISNSSKTAGLTTSEEKYIQETIYTHKPTQAGLNLIFVTKSTKSISQQIAVYEVNYANCNF